MPCWIYSISPLVYYIVLRKIIMMCTEKSAWEGFKRGIWSLREIIFPFAVGKLCLLSPLSAGEGIEYPVRKRWIWMTIGHCDANKQSHYFRRGVKISVQNFRAFTAVILVNDNFSLLWTMLSAKEKAVSGGTLSSIVTLGSPKKMAPAGNCSFLVFSSCQGFLGLLGLAGPQETFQISIDESLLSSVVRSTYKPS